MNKIIPLVIASNEKYISHAITLTMSILQKSSKDLIYKLYIEYKKLVAKSKIILSIWKNKKINSTKIFINLNNLYHVLVI